ncbi:unnamed protein product [Menidia menidia]|uniref:(Atlantic silverside) hypothetical protein n=1 Tax=Menidia menidia TaxID=238744 RepID=A0A8S4AZE3_9TELE|nr:unnamed protein product [Menidia menidia]
MWSWWIIMAAGAFPSSCDRLCVNGSAQTAYDVAKFWGHGHIAALLARSGGGGGLSGGGLAGGGGAQENFFSREPLDRLSSRRADAVWMDATQSRLDSVYLLFSRLSPMVSTGAKVSAGAKGPCRLRRLSYQAVRDLLQQPESVLVFLGVERAAAGGAEPRAWFALDSSEDAGELLKRGGGQQECSFLTTPNRDLLRLSEEEAGVVAQARSVLAWHDRYRFCPTCGARTRPEDAGYKRSCLEPQCRSRQGVHNTCYPRVGTGPAHNPPASPAHNATLKNLSLNQQKERKV